MDDRARGSVATSSLNEHDLPLPARYPVPAMSNTSTRASGTNRSNRTTRKAPSRKSLTARTADRYDLYQRSVQEPDVDLDVIDRVYKSHYGQLPARLREDFAGTAYTASRFVQRRKSNVALGVDLDPVPLAWGARHIVPRLSAEEQTRLSMMEADVMSPEVRKCGRWHCVLAFNFSYWLFQQREQLITYFRSVRRSMDPKGLFFLDWVGGSDLHTVLFERTRKPGGFTYVWGQKSFDPLTHHMTCSISFEFPDGSKMKDAFEYDWRLWSMPEVRECLIEAGFASVETYLEAEDKDGKGTGVYKKFTAAEADRSVLAYVVAVP